MNDAFRHMKLDFRSSIPIYLQIVDRVERMITEGILKTGDQLPTVRELATELRVNFNTVARAYRILDDAHIISTQRGRGTYIWEEPDENTLQDLRRMSLEEAVRHAVNKLTSLGFSPLEILEAVQHQVDKRSTHPDV
ncbi:MAG TPA: GntR family transcriptional regulator [Anaerolineaceae bacterium]|nr:GntR family transcriptional regulator [Anaerolineaceae bacterium]HQN04746.1 GntR family transcriptional regulator [Anaerolineaceae bacterium]